MSFYLVLNVFHGVTAQYWTLFMKNIQIHQKLTFIVVKSNQRQESTQTKLINTNFEEKISGWGNRKTFFGEQNPSWRKWYLNITGSVRSTTCGPLLMDHKKSWLTQISGPKAENRRVRIQSCFSHGFPSMTCCPIISPIKPRPVAVITWTWKSNITYFI